MNYFESIEKILGYPQYSLKKKEKESLLLNSFIHLNKHHYKNCDAYRSILEKVFPKFKNDHLIKLEDIPYIPVQLFKDFELISTDRKNIFKTMLSSGTSGKKQSKIFLDKETAILQTKVLSNIVASFLGSKRVPMLIIDSQKVIKERNLFSVRRAATLGFSIFGKEISFALDENMNLDLNVLKKFQEISKKQKTLIFGFTNIVWTNLINSLLLKKENIDLTKSMLIHGGGWKKLQDQKISNKDFKDLLYKTTNISNIINYYGMVEQTGSVYMECEKGFLHSSNFSDILIRKKDDFSICQFKEKGIIQVFSVLPFSYPGHSLLTEDLGTIYGEDDCPCGRSGKYFKVFGRIPKAEIRGCSDAY